MEKQLDRIAAIATAAGPSALSVVRLSGMGVLEIGRKLLRPFPVLPAPRRMIKTWLYDGEELVDELLAVYMPGPNSYTGEDVLELSLHGGGAVCNQALALCLGNGARMAEPGEFTRRALKNGKLDMAQAQSIMQLISARTERQARVAARQLTGAVGRHTKEIQAQLLTALAAIEASLDYPDEISEEETAPILQAALQQALQKTDALLSQARSGAWLRDGARVCLCGLPNAGKSTLFNALAGRERAIVTAQAGTTRDTLEETGEIQGIPVIYVDMAGLRDTEDPVERIGVQRARAEIRQADLVIWLEEAGQGGAGDSQQLAQEWAAVQQSTGVPILRVLSKSDRLGEGESGDGISGSFDITLSVVTGSGLDELKARIAQVLEFSPVQADCLVLEERQLAEVRGAKEALRAAEAGIMDGEPLDLVSIRLHGALSALGKCTGDDVDEALLDEVFARFCVGK